MNSVEKIENVNRQGTENPKLYTEGEANRVIKYLKTVDGYSGTKEQDVKTNLWKITINRFND